MKRTHEPCRTQHCVFHPQIGDMIPDLPMRHVSFRVGATKEQYKSLDAFRFRKVDESRHRFIRLVDDWVDDVHAIDVRICLERVFVGGRIEPIEFDAFATEGFRSSSRTGGKQERFFIFKQDFGECEASLASSACYED